jgi:hypothetical protein
VLAIFGATGAFGVSKCYTLCSSSVSLSRQASASNYLNILKRGERSERRREKVREGERRREKREARETRGTTNLNDKQQILCFTLVFISDWPFHMFWNISRSKVWDTLNDVNN